VHDEEPEQKHSNDTEHQQVPVVDVDAEGCECACDHPPLQRATTHSFDERSHGEEHSERPGLQREPDPREMDVPAHHSQEEGAEYRYRRSE
jgi:hypothetical protein